MLASDIRTTRKKNNIFLCSNKDLSFLSLLHLPEKVLIKKLLCEVHLEVEILWQILNKSLLHTVRSFRTLFIVV